MKDCAKDIEKILEQLSDKSQSVAIICKTIDEIKLLQKQSSILKKFKVLNEAGSLTKAKNVITTPAKAKGVEFDCVIVPFTNDTNYHNELDKNLLYVSATRALHKLYFVADKKPSRFLTKKIKNI